MRIQKKLLQVILLCLIGTVVHANGDVIYQKKCMACHEHGVAGAPKKGDKEAWATRLAERGIEGLYSSALQGRKAMPPKGGCFDCTDEQIKQAVDSLVKAK